MVNFQFEQLQTIAAVVREGTFEAAAQRLHVTASAVSQRIKAMEQTAGRVLLQRSTPIAATEAGDVVLRLARQVEQLQQDTARELGAGHDGDTASIPLVVNADSLATWFLPALARFGADSSATFDLHREDEQHSAALLRTGRVMAAVTATPEPVQGCSVEGLGAMRYRAVASPEFVRAWMPDGIAGSGFGQAPVLEFDRKDQLQRRFFTARTGRRLTAPTHVVPASAEFTRAAVLGLGWALLPEEQCAEHIGGGKLIELAPAEPVDVPLFWQRWKISSALLDELSDAVRATAATHLRAA